MKHSEAKNPAFNHHTEVRLRKNSEKKAPQKVKPVVQEQSQAEKNRPMHAKQREELAAKEVKVKEKLKKAKKKAEKAQD